MYARSSLFNKIWILRFSSLHKLASKSQELLADISLSILLYLLFGLFFFVKQCRNRFNHLVSATHVCKQIKSQILKHRTKSRTVIFYTRYVNEHKINALMLTNQLSNIHNALQFRSTLCKNKRITFLDSMTGKSSYHIKLNIHREPTITDNLPIPIPTTLKKISGSMPCSDAPLTLP